MSTTYVTSDNIKFYPSAYRQYTTGGNTLIVNPEARYNTEYNLTSRMAKILKSMDGSYIAGINSVDSSLEFFIKGYYCKLLGTGITEIQTQFSSATKIYANIKVVPFTPVDNTLNFTQLYEVVNYANNNKELDDGTNFGGIAFSDSEDSNATKSMLIYEKVEGVWELAKEYLYPLTTQDIKDSSGKGLNEQLTTDTVDASQVNTDDANVSHDLEIGGTLKVDVIDANNDSSIDLNASVSPTQNNVIELGSNSYRFAKVYATKFEGEAAKATKWTNGITINLNKTNQNTSISVLATASGVDGTGNVNLTLPYLVPINVSSATMLNHVTTVNAYNSNYSATIYNQTLGDGTLNIQLPDISPKAVKLTTSYGSSTNPVYINSNGVPSGSAWSTALYNLLKYTLKYKSTYTYNPNNKSFYAYVGTSGTDYIYMDMYLLIDFNGDKCLMNFVLNNPNPNEANHYTNVVRAYNVVYACVVTSPNSSGRVQVVLKYNSNLEATAESTGWTTVGSEKIQSAVIHTLCLPNDNWG